MHVMEQVDVPTHRGARSLEQLGHAAQVGAGVERLEQRDVHLCRLVEAVTAPDPVGQFEPGQP
jgi:hypothetical protein